MGCESDFTNFSEWARLARWAAVGAMGPGLATGPGPRMASSIMAAEGEGEADMVALRRMISLPAFGWLYLVGII